MKDGEVLADLITFISERTRSIVVGLSRARGLPRYREKAERDCFH